MFWEEAEALGRGSWKRGRLRCGLLCGIGTAKMAACWGWGWLLEYEGNFRNFGNCIIDKS